MLSDQLHMVLPALMAGATVVLPSRSASPERVLADLRRHRITCTFGLPVTYQAIATEVLSAGERLPLHLRMLLLGSAPVYRSMLRKLVPYVAPATEVHCVYAMTEMLPVAHVTLERKLAYEGEGDLVGAPFPGVRVRTAEDGELVVSGPNLFRGYWGEAPPAEHPTGDLGRTGPEGELVLLGRKKDMIVRGAHNIYPGLFEPAINALPGVAQACLIGVYDDAQADERVILVIEPDGSLDEPNLRHRLARSLHYEPIAMDASVMPDAIVFRRLPRSGRSSKVDREALRRELAGAR
jgi:acyl-CoA synthetase (AMP-forming)/AMP-acid ligase II